MRILRKGLRAVRAGGPAVASCDDCLPDAMRAATSPVNGEDNDTHVVVRRLGDNSTESCDHCTRPATWVLIPQAVLR